MILITQPKSGSLTLLQLLSKLTGNRIEDPPYSKLSKCPRLEEKYLTYGTCIESSPSLMKLLVKPKVFYRMRLLPTENNISCLTETGQKALFLYRDTDQVLESYSNHLDHISYFIPSLDYKKLSKDPKTRELVDSYRSWVGVEGVLPISFNELMEDTTNTINSVLKHWDFSPVQEAKIQ